jgi:hypothetical protein
MQADASFDVLAEEAVLVDEKTHSVSTSEIPIALTRVEGRQVAERWLTEARIARDVVRFALPPSKLQLGAGDLVSLDGDQLEGSSVYRIDRIEQGALQLVEAVRIDREVYVAADMSDEVASPPSFVPPVPVLPVFLDLPLMTGDETPHAPFFAATAQPWPGSIAIYQSPSDSDFKLLDVMSVRSIIGFTESDLSLAPSGRLDHGPALRVKLLHGALSSVDTQALLSGANLAAIGDGSSGSWELFQFRDVKLVDKDTYLLTARLRGQFGTDGTIPDVWPENSLFILLNGIPEQISLSRNLRRVAQTYRVGPARRSVADPSYVEKVEAFDGIGLRPYAPVHLHAENTPEGAIVIKWIRRTRIDGDDWDIPEVPLGEETEGYLVRVLKNGSVLREATVPQAMWIYPLSEQAADGLTGQYEVQVSQMSATYGAGPAARIDLQA